MTLPFTPAAGAAAREMLEANGFSRVGTYRQRGRVLSEDYFNEDGLMVVINYSYVKSDTSIDDYRAKASAYGSDL